MSFGDNFIAAAETHTGRTTTCQSVLIASPYPRSLIVQFDTRILGVRGYKTHKTHMLLFPFPGFPRATPDATRSLTHSRCIPARIASRTAQITTPDQWATLRLFVSSWIVRHEKGMTRVGATADGRLAFGDHHEQGSKGTGE
jgi:hypothetical protein